MEDEEQGGDQLSLSCLTWKNSTPSPGQSSGRQGLGVGLPSTGSSLEVSEELPEWVQNCMPLVSWVFHLNYHCPTSTLILQVNLHFGKESNEEIERRKLSAKTTPLATVLEVRRKS